MILLVDIGNSRIKWASLQAGVLIDIGQAPHRERALDAVLDEHWCARAVPSAVYVANVIGLDAARVMLKWARAHWRVTPIFVVAQAQAAGVRNAYAQPERLGVDRWLALLAARRHSPLPAVIVGCGTAMTVDALAADGQHLGGVIIPGAYTMATALAATTHLQAPELVVPAHLALAQNTHDAVIGGVWYALAGAVERIFDERAKQWQCEPQLILSGGDASLLAPLLQRPVQRIPNLVLEGLACLVPTQSSSG
ncbi:MAG: type III pantothenate kinase [Pseudomonadota bacterium]